MTKVSSPRNAFKSTQNKFPATPNWFTTTKMPAKLTHSFETSLDCDVFGGDAKRSSDFPGFLSWFATLSC